MAKKTVREIIMEDARLRKNEEKKGWYIFIRSEPKSGYVPVDNEYVNVLGPATDADVDDISHTDEVDVDVLGPFPSRDAAMKKAGIGKSKKEAEKASHGGSFCDFCKAKGPQIKLTPDGTNYACPECMPKKEAEGTDRSVVLVTADWNDTSELLSNLTVALKKLGLFPMDSPGLAGGDTIGFYISTKKLSQDDLHDLDQEFNVVPDEG